MPGRAGCSLELAPPPLEESFWADFQETEARLEGLEPPTRCLEGSCSIHLSYRRVEAAERESGRADLNRRPPAPKAGALAGLRHSPFRSAVEY